jgi:hypothetical protein
MQISVIPNKWVLFIGLIVGASPASAVGILWENLLPTANLNNTVTLVNRSNAAPVYGSLADVNKGGSVQPFILGDQFQLFNISSTITSFTIYEVGNVGGGPNATPGDTPDTEFSNVSLYIGPDSTGVQPLVASLSGAALLAASAQVCYAGATCNFQSLNSGTVYFPIYAITFSGLSLTLAPGLYDFSIGATPIGGNTFALHMSDPLNSGVREDSSTLGGSEDFLYSFFDGPGNVPLTTYQYAGPGPNGVVGWTNPDPLDVNAVIVGTSVPEPATLAVVAAALLGLFGLKRRGSRPATQTISQ